MPGPPLDPFCLMNVVASSVYTPPVPQSIFLFRFGPVLAHGMSAGSGNTVRSVVINNCVVHQPFGWISLHDLNRLLCFFSFPGHKTSYLKKFSHTECDLKPC